MQNEAAQDAAPFVACSESAEQRFREAAKQVSTVRMTERLGRMMTPAATPAPSARWTVAWGSTSDRGFPRACGASTNREVLSNSSTERPRLRSCRYSGLGSRSTCSRCCSVIRTSS